MRFEIDDKDSRKRVQLTPEQLEALNDKVDKQVATLNEAFHDWLTQDKTPDQYMVESVKQARRELSFSLGIISRWFAVKLKD